MVFVDNYPSVIECLEDIVSLLDRKTADKARIFLQSLTDSAFIVALCCAKKVMSLTITLSRALQTVNKDLINAMEGVSFVIETLEAWRVDQEEWSTEEHGPFAVAQKLAGSVGEAIRIPRLASRQCHRSNVPAKNTEEY